MESNSKALLTLFRLSHIVRIACVNEQNYIMQKNVIHRWTVNNIKSAPISEPWPWITIYNPVATLMWTSINLVTKQTYNPGIVKCKPWCTYSPLVPKRDTFMLLTVHLWCNLVFGNSVFIWMCLPVNNKHRNNWKSDQERL